MFSRLFAWFKSLFAKPAVSPQVTEPVAKPAQDQDPKPGLALDPVTAGYLGVKPGTFVPDTSNKTPLEKPTFESGELSWGSLDGHQAIRNFKAGVPLIATYNFEGPFVATFSEVPGSNAVPTSASFNGIPVPVSQSGMGGGEVRGIVGPCQIAFTAQSDTRWSVGCKAG